MADTGENITVIHAQGRTDVPAHPRRVVIFDPVVLDIVDALGGTVTGVPQNDAPYPDYLVKYKTRNYSNVGTLFEPDYEVLNKIKPDLIIAGGRLFDAYDNLGKIAPVISLDLDDRNQGDSLVQRTILLGSLLGREQQAQNLIKQFNTRLVKVRDEIPDGERAMVLLITGGKISDYPPGSRFGFVFDLLGFKPALDNAVKSGNHGNVVSSELIMSANPDWLFIIDRDSAISDDASQSALQVLDNPLIRKTTAWQAQHIVYLDSRSLYISGGIQAYLRTLEQIDRVVTIKADRSGQTK